MVVVAPASPPPASLDPPLELPELPDELPDPPELLELADPLELPEPAPESG